MKDIFTDLYNKVLGFFRRAEVKEEENTKDVAYNRLKVVLMQDRTNLSPELMDRMRKELIELLSKYVEMDKEALELGFEQEGSQMALMLSIPVVRAKDEAEIEAILAEEDAEKAKNQEVTESEEDNEITDETKTSDDEADIEDSDESEIEAEEIEPEIVDADEETIVEDLDTEAKETEDKKVKSAK